MSISDELANLIGHQHAELESLLVQLFDKSLEGLRLTRRAVEDLRARHAWYDSNLKQIYQLKRKITSIEDDYDRMINAILRDIHNKKEHVKQILHDALEHLETTLDKNLVQRYVAELLYEIDKLFNNMSLLVLVGSIFGAFGLFPTIAVIIGSLTGSVAAGAATFGAGLVVGGIVSEVLFRNKLSELSEKLMENIIQVSEKKILQLVRLNRYFDTFTKRLSQSNSDQSKTDIVWFDKNIHSDENQSFAQRLSREFTSENNYQVVQFNVQKEAIEFIQSNIENNIILITSGSAGTDVLSETAYYPSIKGIIIYCMEVDTHRLWSGIFKKLLLVTNESDEVIHKIQQIERGDIYFLNNGFSLEDAGLKLPNIKYYLSTKPNGFIIENFSSITRDHSYHRTKVEQLYQTIVSKNIYPEGIPIHFTLKNLYKFIDKFLQALAQRQPEKSIISLYTAEEPPYYYKIINGLLNLLDEDLIQLIADYIKALRYALVVYKDTSNKIATKTNVKFYRGLCLKHQNSFCEFQRKFQIGDSIIFPSFLSTSMDEKVAKSFAKRKGVILEITADCTKINKPKNISTESKFEGENEALLNCFSVLHVTHVRRNGKNLFVYECFLK